MLGKGVADGVEVGVGETLLLGVGDALGEDVAEEEGVTVGVELVEGDGDKNGNNAAKLFSCA